MSHLLRRLAGDVHTKVKNCIFRLSANKRRFVIVGTGRSGTNYIADRLSAESVECLHERFFTTDGPSFDVDNAAIDERGESSWLAVPYLPLAEIPLAHVTRHPIGVIRSFYNIGFFHSEKYGDLIKFVQFAKQHFTFSYDPFRSSLRRHIEWNFRCLELTKNHIWVEELCSYLSIRIVANTSTSRAVGKATNSRSAKVTGPVGDVRERLKRFPEYPQLCQLAGELGYDLSGS